MAEANGTTERLAIYISRALERDLPADVEAKARLHLLDTLAAMVSGTGLAAGERIVGHMRTSGDAGESSLPGSGLRLKPSQAALSGGICAHSDETDDSHAPSLTHPGCVIVPAALAVAEDAGASGAELVRAVVLGYDVSTRVSMALGGSRFADTYHLSSHGWAGPFGAAAAACALWRLTAEQTVFALSYCVQMASGNRCWLRDPDHVQKAFIFGGMPARSGVEAAVLARSGFTGVSDAIEGTPGFIAAFRETSDISKVLEGLGERYEIMRTTIKKWCVGSPIQAALDCIEAAVRDLDLRASDVASILVTLPEQRSRVAQSDMPDINLPHVMALYLVDAGVGFASLHDHARMQDPAVRQVAARVSVMPRPGAARGEQAHFTLTTTDGRDYHREPDSVRGQPSDPMTEDEVTAKALDLLSTSMSERRARDLVDAVLRVEEMDNVRKLRRYWEQAKVPTTPRG